MKIVSKIKLGIAEHYQYSIVKYNEEEFGSALYNQGILIAPEPLATNEIGEIDQACTDVLVRYPEYVAHESNDADRRIYGIDRLVDVRAINALAKKLLPLARQFYGVWDVKYFCMFGEIKATDNNVGSGSGWHRDSPFRHQFKCIVYLTDVTDRNGPFEYIPKSHAFKEVEGVSNVLKSQLNQDRFEDQDISNLVKNKLLDPVSSITGTAGMILYADTRGLHRGKPLVAGMRRAITYYFYAEQIPHHFSLPPEAK
jgi:hypothetical protein